MNPPQSLLGTLRLASLVRSALFCAPMRGEFWECGVYQGGSALALAQALAKRNCTLRLFDSFTGIKLAGPADNGHKDGDFADTSLEAVQVLMQPYPFVHIHPGTFPDTFAGHEDARVAFAHIDCDVYASTKAALEFIWPRLLPAGIVVVDDYAAPSCLGSMRAVHEFQQANPAHYNHGLVECQLTLQKPCTLP